ncbi:MAG: DUF1161 domain-containing protein [Ideonella sp.]|nr:DUF1161 domain-containing protein [Ideonella sp.]
MIALAAVSCASASIAAAAPSTCDALREQIEAKIRAAGVAQFSVTVIDAAASAPGKVVGSCERGTRRIVYRRGGDEGIVTECKDGSVSRDGRCGH